MKLLKTKTARFAQVIEECGKPQVYTLWQKPSTDRHLQAELKKNRVMTILNTESGTDFGIAGFKESKGAHLPRFSQVVETVCGQASGRNRLDACSRIGAILSRWPGQRALAKKMHMQVRNTFARIWPAIDDDTIAVR